ncbi:Uncharacterized protein, DUF1810 family [Sphingomonas sp. YR710]|uniref:DUF1810 domain-containing protein n=1 Tax=Sphingomonas sp. YR710 TaxID=1882773 RepID=UPI00087FC692|nr:DUF1810 domain-containing protein [Sphingomonas sp. YR710]SDC98603.1 Uncharacterized protein, DUF1810 family [Sphingomonas sp. YR710]
MPDPSDPFELRRFVVAQAAIYRQALAEIRQGRKASHWMWFIFPQIAGLGHSATARRYAIGSIAEARAYLNHPILGARLRECVEALRALPPISADAVFGPIDAVKLRSSLTLFAAASQEAAFAAALLRWFDAPDPATIERIAG